MRRIIFGILIACLMFGSGAAMAAQPFYQGKTVRITVGFSAGGGFDLWARLIARHIGKYIPGNPTVVVENITGAGGLIQVNQFYRATKSDGLTMAHINGGLILSQMVGQPGYEFDSNKFIYIGAAKTFQETVNDKEFLAEIDKMKLYVEYTNGDELGAAVANCAKLDQATRARLKTLLFR